MLTDPIIYQLVDHYSSNRMHLNGQRTASAAGPRRRGTVCSMSTLAATFLNFRITNRALGAALLLARAPCVAWPCPNTRTSISKRLDYHDVASLALCRSPNHHRSFKKPQQIPITNPNNRPKNGTVSIVSLLYIRFV